MSEIKAELVSVGTELLLGQIVNTNAAWISQQLANKGISVYYHSVVGDNFSRLSQVFEQAEKRSDIVLITGGLGPTEDDLTREAFQHISGLEIVEDSSTMGKMTAFFANRGNMTPNNRKQAHIFKGAQVINNSVGIAPGMIIEYRNTLWIFMPGVPREMEAIMADGVLPYLAEHFDLTTIIRSRMLRFIGIGESQLEHELQDIISNQTNPTIAPLASEGEVALRLTAKANKPEDAEVMIDETEALIADKVGQFLYGYDEESIEHKVYQELLQKQWTLASAESLTGGAFGAAVVNQPGASAVFKGSAVVYQPEAKQSVLLISEELIDRFGTVSKECAEAMANGACKAFTANIGISFTGVAGPDSLEGHPAGTIYITIASQENCETKSFRFHGDRQTIRNRAVKKGFELLHAYLQN
ncbi:MULTISPECIES: competence/damage-inducible protein A [Gracilibacillus]|uniref:competence/damage-inducible protein A n=1 Tax=Gracilibacillus TaxID=74385 RepID=UPI00082404F2|nr:MULTISPECIES: competence/damage-inducible protein A [Gracilibacillus]